MLRTEIQVTFDVQRAKQAESAIEGVSKSIEKHNYFVDSMLHRWDSVAKAYVSFQIIRGLGLLFKEVGYGIIEANAQMEYFREQLSVVTGSLPRARELLDWLTKFAIETPFVIKDVIDASIRMQSFGVATQKYLKYVGDWAAMMRTSISDMAVRFGKVVLGSQQTNRLLARMGISMNEFNAALMRTGDRAEALASVIRTKFPDAMHKMVFTFKGLLSNLEDVFFILKYKIGQAVFTLVSEDFANLHKRLREIATSRTALLRIAESIKEIYIRAKDAAISLGHFFITTKKIVDLVTLRGGLGAIFWASFMPLLITVIERSRIFLALEKAWLTYFVACRGSLGQIVGVLKLALKGSIGIKDAWKSISLVTLPVRGTLMGILVLTGLIGKKIDDSFKTWKETNAVISKSSELLNQIVSFYYNETEASEQGLEILRNQKAALELRIADIQRTISQYDKLTYLQKFILKGDEKAIRNLDTLRSTLEKLTEYYTKISEREAEWTKLLSSNEITSRKITDTWYKMVLFKAEAGKYDLKWGISLEKARSLLTDALEKLKERNENFELQLKIAKQLDLWNRKGLKGEADRLTKLMSQFNEEFKILKLKRDTHQITVEEFKTLGDILIEKIKKAELTANEIQKLKLISLQLKIQKEIESTIEETRRQAISNITEENRALSTTIRILELKRKRNQISQRELLSGYEEAIKVINDQIKRLEEIGGANQEILSLMQNREEIEKKIYQLKNYIKEGINENLYLENKVNKFLNERELSLLRIHDKMVVSKEELREQVEAALEYYRAHQDAANSIELQKEALRALKDIGLAPSDWFNREFWDSLKAELLAYYEDITNRVRDTMVSSFSEMESILSNFFVSAMDKETTFKEVREELWTSFFDFLKRKISEIAAMWFLQKTLELFGIRSLYRSEEGRLDLMKQIRKEAVVTQAIQVAGSVAAYKLTQKTASEMKRAAYWALAKSAFSSFNPFVAFATLATGAGVLKAGEKAFMKAAEGFEGMVTRPTLFLTGEAGPERVSITPEGALPSSSEGGVVIQVMGDVYDFQDFVEKVHTAKAEIIKETL